MEKKCVQRVLYVHGGILLRGGTEAYMMNYYRQFDPSCLQVDFMVHGYEKGVYDDEILEKGGRIHHLPLKTKAPIKYFTTMWSVMKSGEYRIVHAHMDTMNVIPLFMAKLAGVPVRISHSHSTSVQTASKLKKLLHEIIKKTIRFTATHLFACSEMAGEWLYGDTPFRVIPNAIDLSRFSYDETERVKIRKQLNVDDNDIVLGHVGRVSAEKNQHFLLEVLRKVKEKRLSCKLVMVGDGPLKEGLKDEVSKLNLVDDVRFVDACSDVYRYYQAFDWFCLPSLFEGLPVVGIEAQVNGLRCLVSDRVTEKLNKTGNVSFLPIGVDDAVVWSDMICTQLSSWRDKNALKKMQDAGYDIHSTSKALQAIYLDMM